MCLLVFAWNVHPEYRLIVAAIRDEYHLRPTRELQRWPDRPDIVAGRDLQAGGTWLAIRATGRFATVTNYREGRANRPKSATRGSLVKDFIAGNESPRRFNAAIDGDLYTGFNLLTCDGQEFSYVSNRGDDATILENGIYGLSNAGLDTPWPKLTRTRKALQTMLQTNTVNESSLMKLMANRDMASVADVEHSTTNNNEIPFALAQALSAAFIVTPDYGTRCTTTLLWTYAGRMSIAERRFDADGGTIGTERFAIETTAKNP